MRTVLATAWWELWAELKSGLAIPVLLLAGTGVVLGWPLLAVEAAAIVAVIYVVSLMRSRRHRSGNPLPGILPEPGTPEAWAYQAPELRWVCPPCPYEYELADVGCPSRSCPRREVP